jgi:hypothetical protein
MVDFLRQLLAALTAKPAVPEEYTIKCDHLSVQLESVGIRPVRMCDGVYYYVSLSDWYSILAKTRNTMPAFIHDKFDCDNFAFLTSAMVSLQSKLNGCGVIMGDSPYGYHAWNGIWTPDGLYYFEPQTGALWPSSQSTYKGKEAIFF